LVIERRDNQRDILILKCERRWQRERRERVGLEGAGGQVKGRKERWFNGWIDEGKDRWVDGNCRAAGMG
jgi:hypothetical protein